MTKLTASEFTTTAQQLVGNEDGWMDRLATRLNMNPKTVSKFAENGCSHGTTQALYSALGLPSGFEPTAEETAAHNARWELRRMAGMYSSN